MYYVLHIPVITGYVEVKKSKKEKEAQQTTKDDDTVKKPCNAV